MFSNISCEKVMDSWVKGSYKDYDFTYMLFEEPSKYGIEGGKVSKLCIKGEDGDWLVNYDRGWDVKPTEDILSDYTDILNYLEAYNTSE